MFTTHAPPCFFAVCHNFELFVDSDISFITLLMYSFWIYLLNEFILPLLQLLNYVFRYHVSICALLSAISFSLQYLFMFVFLLLSLRCLHLFFFQANLFFVSFSNTIFLEPSNKFFYFLFIAYASHSYDAIFQTCVFISLFLYLCLSFFL